MIDHKRLYKTEYLNLCNIYGSFKITSILSLKIYSEMRSYKTQKELLKEVDKLFNI